MSQSSVAATLHDRWNARVVRARRLAGVRAEAAALLSFYARLAAYQSSLVHLWSADVDRQAPPRTLRESLGVRLPLGAVGDALEWLERSASDGLRRGLPEWGCARVGCVGCGERTFESLPVYTTGQAPGVRIDGCDTWRRYLKTFDLSVDGLQISLVDDLATVTLDLWAREQGYTRIGRHVLRV